MAGITWTAPCRSTSMMARMLCSCLPSSPRISWNFCVMSIMPRSCVTACTRSEKACIALSSLSANGVMAIEIRRAAKVMTNPAQIWLALLSQTKTRTEAMTSLRSISTISNHHIDGRYARNRNPIDSIAFFSSSFSFSSVKFHVSSRTARLPTACIRVAAWITYSCSFVKPHFPQSSYSCSTSPSSSASFSLSWDDPTTPRAAPFFSCILFLSSFSSSHSLSFRNAKTQRSTSTLLFGMLRPRRNRSDAAMMSLCVLTAAWRVLSSTETAEPVNGGVYLSMMFIFFSASLVRNCETPSLESD
mmetsp:Transcript_31083/g.74981  ORF Transcript_31083/g.74981 Transcript_31083/m.74981 type:complete len:302 (-) Transcript_31083:5081-5986(-)